MKINKDPLSTPVYLKEGKDFQWPSDKMFYLLAQEGIYLCRNHPFFRSSVLMKGGPKELASHDKLLELGYPELPKALVERAVGFFRLVAEKQNSEAAALWIWNRTKKQVELMVPEQIGINSGKSSHSPKGYPMDVKYTIPVLEPHQMLIGDIHCHVDGSAYASYTDENDEMHRAGIHIVVGHIYDKLPTFYCDAVVDGERFEVKDLKMVWEGFDKVDTTSVPPEWVGRVKLEEKKFSYMGSDYGYSSYGSTTSKVIPPDDSDRRIIKNIIKEFRQKGSKPTFYELRQALFSGTKCASYLYCEKKAEKVLEHWPKEHHDEDEKAA